MSSDNSHNSNDMARQQRRGSVTSAAFTNLFRSNSISQAQATSFPTPLTSATLGDQRRRLSITTLGLSGTSPTTTASLMRRASLSTNSDSIDENAVEDDDVARTAPTTPFTRRMSFGANQAVRGVRGGTSPGNGRPSLPVRRSSAARGSPPTPPLASALGSGNYTWGSRTSQASSATHFRPASDMSPPARSDQGFNWSDQLRSRAESTVAGSRVPFFSSGLSASPPRGNGVGGGGPPSTTGPRHDRARSVSDMPVPPAQAPKSRTPQKPDHFQERILKGDFYMD
ncbi:hypothetical protein B0T26DRAFT_632663 [Lasiosphaeria miniovina]|uniref:Uncharacterized protein n=1 Tax=Lasiosphaeria miniovina TaxID=1954250 RepID=A0AA40BGW5_9PEZI|nr:uncharacterized protein B0T26DRAFT_632663 [Lasiosphaeria miniovina]KAK0733979.1 hypothetical protein B0T26DRAFT_632663 [Lasiosphaeria miniovina]